MKRFGIIAMFMILLTSCQEELFNNEFEKGLPAAIDLELTVPVSEEVVMTRGIGDYESEIRELVLVLASGNSIQNIVDLTGNLTSQSKTENGGRTYKLTSPVAEGSKGTILSGTYTVYGIANWSSPFCNLTTDEIMGFKDVNAMKAALASNPDYIFNVSGSQLFPMSGVNQSVALLPLETSTGNNQAAPDGNAISLTLTRLVSHIEFVFQNGTNDENPKFTPTSYSIYNLPMEAKLLSADDNKVSTEYGNVTNLEIAGSEIKFFMLENVMPAGKNETYPDRDKWTGDKGALPEDKDFTYAPDGSTFVVVYGEYSGKSYFGNVSYTIHLGNFSKVSTDRSKAGYNNYTVNRNEYHKYTVTVNGVNSIVTESQLKDDTPAAEGEVTQLSNRTQFVLDSHYETVMLAFSLDGKCGNPSMIINTPYTNGTEKYQFSDNNYSDADYKWIHFMAPSSTSTLPKYNANKACTLDVLAEELKTALNNGGEAPSGAHFIISGGNVYTAAFIDEYYYEGNDWTEFVNTDNRLIIFNPDEQVSTDGNSISYPDYIFSVAQRSIKTVYSMDPSLNAFGIETWDETGLLPFVEGELDTYQKNDLGLTLDDSHGWANTKAFWLQESNVVGNGWTRGEWIATDSFGYIESVSDNLKESHKYTVEGVSKLNSFNACLARNRDEDGDGEIDEDEIKWYLPAIEQYTTLWLGDEYLKEDTRLFDATTQDYLDGQIQYFSSSTHTKRLYYPAEGAAYGKVEDATWAPSEQNVRCVRSLKDRSAVPASMSTNDEDLRIIYVNGASDLTLRQQNVTGEYKDLHVERDADNKLPSAFQVAQVVLGENLPLDEPITTPVVTTTWLTPGEEDDVTVTYTYSLLRYTYNIAFSFVGEPNVTYSAATNNTTIANENNVWTVTYNVSRTYNTSGSATVRINATKGSDSQTVNVNVTYKATTTGQSGTGTGTVSYSNVTTETGGETISSIETGKGNNSPDVYTTSTLKSTNDPCATGYYEEADKSDLGYWRVPNQREVMLMIQWDYFPDAKHPEIDGSAVYYTSSTYYTGDNGSGNPFVYIKAGFTRGVGDHMFIRCVRDADPVIGGGSGDNTGGNGGGNGDDIVDGNGGGSGGDL